MDRIQRIGWIEWIGLDSKHPYLTSPASISDQTCHFKRLEFHQSTATKLMGLRASIRRRCRAWVVTDDTIRLTQIRTIGQKFPFCRWLNSGHRWPTVAIRRIRKRESTRGRCWYWVWTLSLWVEYTKFIFIVFPDLMIQYNMFSKISI